MMHRCSPAAVNLAAGEGGCLDSRVQHCPQLLDARISGILDCLRHCFGARPN